MIAGTLRSAGHMVRTPVSTAILALALAGCFGSEATEFPPGLEPLEDNTVPAQQGGAYTETIAYADGEAPNWLWVHGRGYVLAPPAAVWATLQDGELMAAACSTTRHSIEEGVEPDYEYSFRISYVVEEIITIEWDELWRYGTIEGTPTAPELAMIRYQKVYGSELIQRIAGSIQVLATDDPDVTELQLVEHLNAAGGGVADIRGSMQHRFDAVVAVVHGGEPPPCP